MICEFAINLNSCAMDCVVTAYYPQYRMFSPQEQADFIHECPRVGILLQSRLVPGADWVYSKQQIIPILYSCVNVRCVDIGWRESPSESFTRSSDRSLRVCERACMWSCSVETAHYLPGETIFPVNVPGGGGCAVACFYMHACAVKLKHVVLN